MSAAATARDLTSPPDAWAGRVMALVHLLRRLTDYGRDLAGSLQQHGVAALSHQPVRFATEDVALILAHIARGLRLAEALTARILGRATSVGADPRPHRPASARGPRAQRAAALPAKRAELPLDALPPVTTLANDLMHRPIGAVIADICRDLGIMPAHPLWRELQSAIMRYRGNYARLVTDTLNRPFPSWVRAEADVTPICPAVAFEIALRLPPVTTGPPS